MDVGLTTLCSISSLMSSGRLHARSLSPLSLRAAMVCLYCSFQLRTILIEIEVGSAYRRLLTRPPTSAGVPRSPPWKLSPTIAPLGGPVIFQLGFSGGTGNVLVSIFIPCQ